ncbi:phytanoyl-CoA dioxygenase family protein [Bacillus sp. SM2101]|uniref:phytanoyl-CoA dioxygenase family protein n=1 Tax=Bacillus sp. SM2101 TaxID=2805366 RepID=UPI001BDE36D8
MISPIEINQTLCNEFNEHGHVKIKNLINKEDISILEKEIDKLIRSLEDSNNLSKFKRNDFGKGFLEVTNLWTKSNRIKKLVHSRQLAEISAKLLNVNGVRLHYDCILYKSAKSGPTPWHQDQVAWPLDTDKTITLWIPINNLSEKLGSLNFLTSSHKYGELSLRKALRQRSKEFNYGSLEVGDVTFHSGWTFHSANPNHLDTTRKAFAIIYYADGAKLTKMDRSDEKDDFYQFFPNVKVGELANSHLNPLLYSS